MYTAIDRKIVFMIIGAVFIITTLAFISLWGWLGPILKFTAIVGTTSTILYLVFGLSASWAPWRFIWRKFPMLNELVFPDINGMWVGKMQSNFPRKKKLAEGAWSNEKFNLAGIDEVPLLRVPAVFQIKASFFSIKICAAVSGVNGTSKTIVVKALKDQGPALYCIYDQSTPEAAATDEGRHLGAAEAKFRMENGKYELTGSYWNKRNWSTGLNLAGLLEFNRDSSQHSDPVLLLKRIMDK